MARPSVKYDYETLIQTYNARRWEDVHYISKGEKALDTLRTYRHNQPNMRHRLIQRREPKANLT